MFSPYYAWSGRKDPFNHCALNVALYRPKGVGNVWAMTERGRANCEASKDHFQIGRSALQWKDDCLEIRIDETATLIPRAVKGVVRIRPLFLNDEGFHIDNQKRHFWRLIAPVADVEASFSVPDLNWEGRGYLDSNAGAEALEDGFANWDWARLTSEDDRATILYNCAPRVGAPTSLALNFSKAGVDRIASPPSTKLPPTRIWRIARETPADAGTQPRIVRTLEDTPFYARSEIENTVEGKRLPGVHEAFDGDRLQRSIVKAMLTFRMPRRAH
ncbi:MAG: hydratase [Pseudomonadota bacterium]